MNTGEVMYHKRRQETPIVADDFLSTPCLQTVQYDSGEDSQLVTGFMSGPGSAVSWNFFNLHESKSIKQHDIHGWFLLKFLSALGKITSQELKFGKVNH